MKDNFVLSEKRKGEVGGKDYFYWEEDVKEFIIIQLKNAERIKKEWEDSSEKYRRTAQEEEIIEDWANFIQSFKYYTGDKLIKQKERKS